jgi:hypothetical protein
MTSQRKIASNRRNAKKSTGPSEESRGRTRLNAVTHGMRALTLLLPWEDPLSLDALRETWFNKLKPRDPAEDELASEVVKAFWWHRRAERALFEHFHSRIEQADAREKESVAGDIRRLFSDARGPHSLYALLSNACGGPSTSWPTGDRENPDEPSVLVERLESSERGCLALTEHWRTLRSRLVEGLEWQPQDRLKGIRMLGRQPVEAVEDQQVWLIYAGSFALHPGEKDHAFEDLKTDMGKVELEAYLDRVQSRWPLLLDASDTPKARQALFDLVDRNIERLAAKVDVYRSLAAERAASRAGRLASDGSPEADRLKRYEHASDRRAQRSLDAFWKCRRQTEGEDWTEGEGEDGGRRAEDGGDRGETENAGDSMTESGVAGVEPNVENTNLTSEANGGLTASEAAGIKEVAACDEAIKRGLAEISRLCERGMGTPGAQAFTGGEGRAAIEDMVFSKGRLLPPIS